MNTAAAAIQANVTTDTIRTWCRRNVVSAVKKAGRWIIDAASLTRRITIGATRARKAQTVAIDLNATYTANIPGYDGPVTMTPTVKRRKLRFAPTGEKITISDMAPLFADRFDAIADEGDRLHALIIFRQAIIVIFDSYNTDWEGHPLAREGGRLRTTYQGDIPGISVDDVLDLAAQIRTQLA